MKKEMNNMKILYVTLGIALLIALLAIIPWIGFWAVNTLFAFHIPLTWSTGLAFWVLIAMLKGGDTTFRRGVSV
jgi:TRAP-type C4-dicarboxylate transport system permease small subunit